MYGNIKCMHECAEGKEERMMKIEGVWEESKPEEWRVVYHSRESWKGGMGESAGIGMNRLRSLK